MAYALRSSGLFLGLFFLCAVAAMTDYSLVLLVKSGELSNTKTYQVRSEIGKEHSSISLFRI